MSQTSKESTNSKSIFLKNEHILTVLICAISIPLSMSMWIINLIYSKFIIRNEGFDEPVVISPARWLASCFIPLVITFIGYRKKSLSLSGAILGFGVGFILTLRGQRNWIQVLCNGGMATQLGLLYLIDVGASEKPIDFIRDYRASWLSMGILGVFASCNGDTWASELGTVISNSEPYLITSLKRVPKGTNGGISLMGTIFSGLGGFIIGLSYYIAILYFSDRSILTYAPPQWPLLVYGTFGGLIGSFIDSLMGATLQYSGMDKNGKIVSHSSGSVKHISGKNILDNHSVNLISTVIMGLLMPTISKYLWPMY
ncbi:transmembrane protein 19 isoform X2 [Achroia grisella]|uniref:transmembrane protein 19 isoform X2 n=1 Tax=Achroia grisella TaxID=688607 RepID=UPI0027D2316F|nr:transmembrane protein 19 isoform X2 [Achroia grisella]